MMILLSGPIKILKRANNILTYAQWREDLKKVSLKNQKAFIRDDLRPKSKLHIFGQFLFPHVLTSGTEVPECHIDLLREMSNPKDSAIIFPRGFAKTTWEKIDTIHDIVYALEPVILYIGNTGSDAQSHFEAMKIELENNARLIDIYGDLVPPHYLRSKKWTNKHFETTNGVNLVARGAGKGRGINIKHKRPSKIIFDDIEDDIEVASAERREKLHKWIYNVVFNSRSNTRSKIKFIGTVISPLCEVLAFYRGHGGIFRKAIENGESIWKDYFPLSKLYQIRDGYDDPDTGRHVDGIGTRPFMQEFQNTPTDEGLAIVPMKWIEPYFYTTIEKQDEMSKVIMLDPQAGQSKGADSYGLCVMGRFQGDIHRYLLELQTGKASQIDQAALLVRTYQRFKNVRTVGIEKVMTQVAVFQIILDWVAQKIDLPDVNNDNRNIPLVAVTPEKEQGGPMAKKTARLEMHQASFERGEVHFHVTQKAFAEKLSCFPAVDHDDDIDALIYCLEWLNRLNDHISLPDVNDPSYQRPITAGLRGRIF